MINAHLETVHRAIQQDRALSDRLDKVTTKKEYSNFVVEVGKAQGFQFTEADVDAAMSAASRPSATDGALSDQQLEAVAGGGFFERWYYERFTSGYRKC